MATDDERRRVAERLRSLSGLDYCKDPRYAVELASDAVGADHSNGYSWDKLLDRLADLIEPAKACDASQDCRDTVASDPTGRGVDSIYDWCRERLEVADGAEDELCCSIMCAIEDYRHPERATAHTVRLVDREALSTIAEEIDVVSDTPVGSVTLSTQVLWDWHDRIRVALGVES